ncbi:MAG: hypothetical protein WCA12_21865 [Burkholderiales bacterium]
MSASNRLRNALVGVLLAAAPFAASAQRLADGNDWVKSSIEQKRAYLYGIANAVSVGYEYDARKVPTGQITFARRAEQGLTGVTMAEAVDRIDKWYQANPAQLDKAVIAVMWLDIAKPRLQEKK